MTDLDRECASRRRNKHNPLFPYKSVILCPRCKRPFLGSCSRGKSGQMFPAYHCSRGHAYFRVKKSEFETAVEKFIGNLKFRPDALERLETVLIMRFREQEARIMVDAVDMGKNTAELEIQKASALKSYLAATSPVVKAGIEQEIEKLDAEIRGAQGERNKLEITEQDIHEFVREAKNIMEHPAELLLNPVNARQQQVLYAAIFDGLPDYHQILDGTPKLAWIFELTSANSPVAFLTVSLQKLKWNIIESTILFWKEKFPAGVTAP